MSKFKCNCEFCGKEIIRYAKSKTNMYFCSTNCKAEWQRNQKPLLKDELIELYIHQNKSANEIAKLVNRNPKRVYEWLVDYGIETRPRGSDYGQLFKKGQESAFKGCKHTEENKAKIRQKRLKDGHVPYLIDGVHWLHKTGRKPASWKGGTTPERQRVYSSKEWKRCVVNVWKRDNAICRRCGKDHRNINRNEEKFDIHHIYGFSEYELLRCNVDNLVLLCHSCHKFVHSKQNINNEFLTIKGSLPNWIKLMEDNKMIDVLNQTVTDRFGMYNVDCVEFAKNIPDNSIHYTLFSPPFSQLYVYSNSDRDMGNCKGDDEFVEHFTYLAKELYRITMPGRLLSFHCMDLPTLKSRDGFIGLKDFPGQLIALFQSVGFIFHSRVTIFKNPVTEMQRTKALGLLHKQIRKDSTMCRQGIPDYIITMRKPGDNPEMVPHDHDNFPVDVWQQYASPVWMDIRQSNTLQRTSARAEKDEKHICPLQLEVIQRCIELWTNPNDIVFDPFAGIGSTPYVALQLGRRGLGCELKESYYNQAKANLELAAKENPLPHIVGQTDITDYIGEEKAAKVTEYPNE